MVDERKIGSTKITRTSLGGSSSSTSKPTSYALVGSEVEIKRGNRRVPATVRYVRQGVGYKVQFEDGRFEWVNENEVIFNGGSGGSSTGDGSYGADHEYLLDDDQEDETYADTSAATAAAAPQPASFKSAVHQPPVLTPQMPLPSSSSANLPRRQMNGVTPSRPATRKPFPQHSHHQGQTSGGGGDGGKNSSSGGGSGNTNFVCPICETKVFNKEPSYIVIRLPACDACAESKILVLDENTK